MRDLVPEPVNGSDKTSEKRPREAQALARARQLFSGARGKPADEQAHFLRQACGHDTALRREVESLLAWDRESGSWADGAAAGLPNFTTTDTQTPAADTEHRFTAGHVVADRYRIVGFLGRGGMGEVYQAEDLTLDRDVALKFLFPAMERHPTFLAHFVDEVRLALRITHPNVCRVHDIAEADGFHFLSMEYVDGEDLATLVERQGRLPSQQVNTIGRQVADGLAAAHQRGVLHRDLKPANLLIDRDGQVLIADFGLAALAESRHGGGSRGGTPSYMAPEQHAGQDITPRSDLYALGLVLYELATGRRPFAGRSWAELAFAHRDTPPIPPSNHVEGIDRTLERVILHCLEKNPAQRPVSAMAVAEALAGGARTANGVAPRTFMRCAFAADGSPQATFHEAHGRLLRKLLEQYGGSEIDMAGMDPGPGGNHLAFVFGRPWAAVQHALDYQHALAQITPDIDTPPTRIAIHFGEIALHWPESPEAEGPPELDGTEPAERLLALAQPGQILLNRNAFDLAREAGASDDVSSSDLGWLAHGGYLFAGEDEAIEVFEVGRLGVAPLAAPENNAGAVRVLGDGVVLGWRPAPGLVIPSRPGWRVVHRLGTGGFGEVWLALGPKDEQRAFKFCWDASRLRGLKREITLFRLLKEELGERDDIARILNWNLDVAPYFVESDYTAAGDLVEWAKAHGGLAGMTLEVRLELVAQVAVALAAAHSVGVLHKDVKPSNVLVHPNRGDSKGPPRIRLTDFGIGMLTERERLVRAEITALGLTEGHALASSYAGTHTYMAPELLEGRPATLQADIYALGVMLYQVVVGDFSRVLASGWQRDIEDEILREDIAAAVEGLPERRLASVGQIADRLRSLAERRAERARHEDNRRTLERSRKQWRWMAAALLLAAVMALVAWQIAGERQRAEEATARARDVARVAVAGEWMARDPTRAALVLLEVDEPDITHNAVSRMRQALRKPLALLELAGHQGWIWDGAWSHDGRYVVTSSYDHTARVWSIQDDRLAGPPRVLAGHGDPVSAAKWSGDSRWIATSSWDATVRIWAVPKHQASAFGAPRVLKGHTGRVFDLAWSHDNRRLASASADGTIRVWELAASPSEKPSESVVLDVDPTPIRCLAWSRDGVWLAAGLISGTVWIWQTGDLAGPGLELKGHTGAIMKLAWSADSRRLATASLDTTARIWDVVKAVPTIPVPTIPVRASHVLTGHGQSLHSVAWSPDGHRVVTASTDTTARVWTLSGPPNGGPITVDPVIFSGHSGEVSTASFSADGRAVLTASFDQTARIWRTDGRGSPLVLAGHGGRVTAARWSPNNRTVLTVSFDHTARIWRADGNIDGVALEHDGQVLDARFSVDGHHLATTATDGEARIWKVDSSLSFDAPSTVLVDTTALVATEAVTRAAWSMDGKRLATASRGGTVRVWDFASGSSSKRSRDHEMQGSRGKVDKIVWSPDGSHLASATIAGSVWIWHLDRPTEPLLLTDQPRRILDVDWRLDARRIAVAAADGGVRIWPITTHSITGPPSSGSGSTLSHAGQVRAARFSPDGHLLATAGIDRIARIWSLDKPDWKERPELLRGHKLAIFDLAWSPSGERLATASADGTVRIWQVGETAPPIVLEGHGDNVLRVTWSDDGQRLLSASLDGTARVWRADGSPHRPIVLGSSSGAVHAADFSPDGQQVFTLSTDTVARVWRLLPTHQLRAALRASTRICLPTALRVEDLGEDAALARDRWTTCKRSSTTF